MVSAKKRLHISYLVTFVAHGGVLSAGSYVFTVIKISLHVFAAI